MIYKQDTGRADLGIFTDAPIEKGKPLFSYDDWIEDEKLGWEVLTPEEVETLSPDERFRFLRYSYDLDFGKMIGTFEWEHAQHISNFMNHSCEPNMMYGDNNTIIAMRDIEAGEELTIDYGTFIVNIDQDFICSCGSDHCRKIIRKDDWNSLAPVYGEHFPEFIAERVRKMKMPISV